MLKRQNAKAMDVIKTDEAIIPIGVLIREFPIVH